ncbi:Uncharacterized membrane protein YkvI [Seinonella peptonophila]|uniref:Uncharacterized membrane protein YkvI n=1 Tax=Seinonella peptonophila TaxID=112248 RepID=A0A1M4WY55_9BACL|nr:hypothetical protein [Seinonella peptonophila]SHE86176.1 Uncharacterized membrane protein YkvI [Seinonella peptonophila]
MRIRLIPSLKISMTIIGTTIGAGFASGREIWEFFGSYGTASHWSLLLSLFLFFGAGMIILFISWRYQTENYAELLRKLMGERFAILFDGLILIYLLTTSIVMLAGSGAIFEQWDQSFFEGCLILALPSFLILFFDIRGLLSINTILMPILSIILLAVFIYYLIQPDPYVGTKVAESIHLPVWPSAIAYAAFNIISLVAVLATMGKTINHPSEIWIAGVISFIVLGLIAILFNICLLRASHLLSQYEIPLFALVQNVSPMILLGITIVLWLSIYTTTVSNLYGLAYRMQGLLPWPHWLIGFLMLSILIPFARIGFSSLVSWLYPLYGVLNLFLLAMIWLYPFTQKE